MDPARNTQPHYHHKFALDDTFYGMDEEDSRFLKERTGIQDDVALKEYVMSVAREAYVIYPYPCIRRFNFTRLNISRHSAYEDFLKLGKTRKDAIFLDIGCAFGNDARKAAVDGWPAQNIVASDLVPKFWELGFKLFNDSPSSFPAHFVPGDVMDQSFLSSNSAPPESLDLTSLASLNPLTQHTTAIYASFFFHLFNEPQQLHLAQCLASLLSPTPGSMILGKHGAKPGEKGLRHKPISSGDGKGVAMFCHSPESWKELWESIFGVGKVKVEAKLEEVVRDEYRREVEEMRDLRFYFMEWSVTRL